MRVDGGEKVQLHILFLLSDSDEVSGRFHARATTPPGKAALKPTGQEARYTPELARSLWRREKSVPHGTSSPWPSQKQPAIRNYVFQ
jgi:hypothetical protein